MSLRPCTERCKWCKGCTDSNPSTCETGLQTEAACKELPPQHQTTTRTIKIEPEWSTRYLEEQQLQDPTLTNFIQMKKSCKERPVWEDISPEGPVLKTLWTQWDRMEVRDGVLYRLWESVKGDRIVYQIVLPSSLTDTALQARNDHPKASHRGLQRTLHSLQLRYYWPGLTAQTYRWVSRCTECAAKKNYRRKCRAPLQQSIVGFPMERIAIDIHRSHVVIAMYS